MEVSKKKAKRAFREPTASAKVEQWYRKRLRQISKRIDDIAQSFDEETDPMEAAAVIQRRLFDYSEQLRDWAADVGGLMVKRTAKIDYDTWLRVGEGISRQTRKLLKSKGVGAEYSRLQQSQIDLITSLPRQAAQDVQEWVKDGLSKGQRFDEIAKRIKKDLGAKSDSRAVLIARTETARSRSNFTQARAKDVGSTHYIWHTVGDGSVRSMHAKLDGTIQRWDDPPVCEHGRGGTPIKGNPGTVWNCRCWAEPLFPKSEYDK